MKTNKVEKVQNTARVDATATAYIPMTLAYWQHRAGWHRPNLWQRLGFCVAQIFRQCRVIACRIFTSRYF